MLQPMAPPPITTTLAVRGVVIGPTTWLPGTKGPEVKV
jgi:hypothetical protein